MVGANLSVMDQDAKRMRGDKPFLFSNMKTKEGLEIIISFIENKVYSKRNSGKHNDLFKKNF